MLIKQINGIKVEVVFHIVAQVEKGIQAIQNMTPANFPVP